MKKVGASLCAVGLACIAAVALAACSSPQPISPVEQKSIETEAYEALGVSPTPTARSSVSTDGDVTATCVDQIGDIGNGTGIDLDTVELARVDGGLKVTWTLASITDVDGLYAVPVSSVKFMDELAEFRLSLKSASDANDSASIDLDVSSIRGWSIKGWDSAHGMYSIRDGDFQLASDKVVVETIPAREIPAGDLEWSAHVVYDHNKSDFCPGVGRDDYDGMLTLPQSS